MTSSSSVSVTLNTSTRQTSASRDEGQVPTKPPGSNDIGWKYEKLINMVTYNGKKWNSCHKILKEEINRLKHVARTGGEQLCFPMMKTHMQGKFRVNQ